MNDKKTDRFDEDIEKLESAGSEPFVKKAAKFSAFIYLGLAILVVVVATVGIFSISYDYDTSVPQVSLPEISLGGLNKDPVSAPSISDDAPVNNEQSGIDADVSAPDVFVCPVANATVLKAYSMDALVFSQTMRDYRVHSGIDLAAAVGSDVMAYSSGTVLSIDNDYFAGTTVAITHEHGTVSYYMNLDPTLSTGLRVGDTVKAGDVIGKIGQSSRLESADSPHLHFELRVNGELIDPTPELASLIGK